MEKIKKENRTRFKRGRRGIELGRKGQESREGEEDRTEKENRT